MPRQLPGRARVAISAEARPLTRVPSRRLLQVRMLMRREKTMKICANFFVAPTTDLKVRITPPQLPTIQLRV